MRICLLVVLKEAGGRLVVCKPERGRASAKCGGFQCFVDSTEWRSESAAPRTTYLNRGSSIRDSTFSMRHIGWSVVLVGFLHTLSLYSPSVFGEIRSFIGELKRKVW